MAGDNPSRRRSRRLTTAQRCSTSQLDAGHDIRVRFMRGDESLRQRVRAVAERWTGPGMASPSSFGSRMRRRRSEAPSSRATARGPTSGRIAKTCRGGADHELRWLTPESSDDEIRRVVSHEFGHALGLIHEHQNP